MSAVVSLAALAPPLPLADRQKQYLAFLRTFQRKNGRAPSRREIGKAMGVTMNAVQGTLVVLQQKGYIRIGVGVDYGIEILAVPGRDEAALDAGIASRAQVIRLRSLVRRAYTALARVTAAVQEAQSSQTRLNVIASNPNAVPETLSYAADHARMAWHDLAAAAGGARSTQDAIVEELGGEAEP